MQFLLMGYDGTDEGALERRLAAREDHLKLFRERVDQGKFLFGSALLNDDGKMIGSMIICEFPSREALDEEWLKHEPYMLGSVWKRVEVTRTQVPPFLLERRSQG
ncbi:MAG: hypothetical protein EHM70_17030 [Chloroflexota bacterium]|nr:MAG: hypothetical protein EHM70_17030 [Chloroflexota bacterium]